MAHVIYKLPANDFDRYAIHLKRLDKISKYMRFGFHISDEAIDNLISNWKVDYLNHHVFVIENNNLEVVAVSHISTVETPIELSFSVLEEYQGNGMGSSLIERSIKWCQNRNIKHGFMICLPNNIKMKKLVLKYGLVSTDIENDESYGKIEIPDPTPFSYLNEFLDDRIAILDHLTKSNINFTKKFRIPLLFNS